VRFALRPSFQPFFRPAVPARPVFTSPHFLPSRASRSQRLALAELVLVGASSVRFQLSAGRCRAVFAFPARREDSVSNGKKIVNLFFAKWQIIFKYKKAPSVKQRGRWVLNSNIT
jgi:hypothetical protein